MKYKADISNYYNVVKESVNGTNIDDLKNACKRPGYDYLIKIYGIYDDLPDELVISYHYKNNRFYKI
jgi:hypothetical protein